jgi:hypothetical protein
MEVPQKEVPFSDILRYFYKNGYGKEVPFSDNL